MLDTVAGSLGLMGIVLDMMCMYVHCIVTGTLAYTVHVQYCPNVTYTHTHMHAHKHAHTHVHTHIISCSKMYSNIHLSPFVLFFPFQYDFS